MTDQHSEHPRPQPYPQQQPAQQHPQYGYGYPPPPQYAGPTGYPSQPEPAKKRKRVFMWFFIAVQIIFLIWVITGAASGSGQPSDCGTLDAKTCNDASNAGTAIGVGIIILLWFLVDVALMLGRIVVQLGRRRSDKR